MPQRIITIRPAFDKRISDDGKNYGIHGCNMIFDLVITSRKTAIRLTFFTNWHLPDVRRELDDKLRTGQLNLAFPYYHAEGAGLSTHHAAKPDDNNATECDIFGFCVGSTMFNEPFDSYKVLTERGSDGIFDELEKYWRDINNVK